MQAAINRAVRHAEAKYREEHPQAGALKTTGQVRVYRKPPKGFYQHQVRIVELLLESRLALEEPNSAFVTRMQSTFSPFVVPGNIMTRPLSRGLLTRIKSVLEKRGIVLDLQRCNSLSKIKLALRARAAGAEQSANYTLNLAFTPNEVIVGDKRFPIHRHSAGYLRIKVGEQRLRVDVLEELAKAAIA